MAKKTTKKAPRPYSDTKVTVAKSRAEIAKLLDAHGVKAVQWTTFGEASMLRFSFEHEGHAFMVRMLVDPERQGDKPPTYWTPAERERHWVDESKRLHRTMYWAIKSRLEVIEAGLESPLQVWLPAIESGTETFAERVAPRAAELAQPNPTLGGMLALPEASHG